MESINLKTFKIISGKLSRPNIGWLVICTFCFQHLSAQDTLTSQNFEDRLIGPAWQIISGNWHIGDVEEMRIAPAENGWQFVLCSGGPGFVDSNFVRLHVDLPDSSRATKIKLSFSYYILANVPGTFVTGEFCKMEEKDGLKRKTWKADLRVKGRWVEFQKILEIPAGATSARIVFYGLKSSGKTSRLVCYDNIIISALKIEPAVGPKKN
jgi:hypothetical protein